MDQEKRKARTTNIVLGCGILFAFFLMVVALIGFTGSSFKNKTDFGSTFLSDVGSSGKDFIGVIYISGIIHSGKSSPGGFMGDRSSGSDTLVRIIDKARENDKCRALLLRVNSPGGSAAGSQEIFSALKRFKEEGDKPVIVSMGDIAASGGYYISAAADTVFANPATLTGSIGVIMNMINYEELFEKLGMKSNAIKSGKHKDIGSPYREMSEEERAILQSTVDNVHMQFVSAVARGRGLEIEEVIKIADGSIFTGEQALELKLVDQVGGMYDAIAFTAEKTGVDPENISYLQGENKFSFLFDMMNDIKPELFGNTALERFVGTMLLNPTLITK
ncbi:MAG TPA: signal peptide peptidase SppA [bacterium]|nr:signal peptide peptidase SppA [bacterium]